MAIYCRYPYTHIYVIVMLKLLFFKKVIRITSDIARNLLFYGNVAAVL